MIAVRPLFVFSYPFFALSPFPTTCRSSLPGMTSVLTINDPPCELPSQSPTRGLINFFSYLRLVFRNPVCPLSPILIVKYFLCARRCWASSEFSFALPYIGIQPSAIEVHVMSEVSGSVILAIVQSFDLTDTQWSCSKCLKTFKRKGDYTRHSLIHEGNP
jgi:hypothetical protein